MPYGPASTCHRGTLDMNVYTVFGSTVHRAIETQLTRGSAFTVFGSTDVDLAQAQLTQDKVILNVFTLFGETTIRIPMAWNVDSSLLTLLGEAQGISTTADTSSQALKIQGLCLLGSCKIIRTD